MTLSPYTAQFLEAHADRIFRDPWGRLYLEDSSAAADRRGALKRLDAQLVYQRWHIPDEGVVRPTASQLVGELERGPGSPVLGDGLITDLRSLMWTPAFDRAWGRVTDRGYVTDGPWAKRGIYLATRPQGRRSGDAGGPRERRSDYLNHVLHGDGSVATLRRWLVSAMNLALVGPDGGGVPPLLIEAEAGQDAACERFARSIGYLVDSTDPRELQGPDVLEGMTAVDTAPDRYRWSRLGKAELNDLEDLIVSGALTEAQAATPQRLWVLVVDADSNLEDDTLLTCPIIRLASDQTGDPLDLARDYPRELLEGLVMDARPAKGQRQVPLAPSAWASMCAGLRLDLHPEGFMDSRWQGRTDQRTRIELFWVGSMHQGQDWAPGRWAQAAHDAGLLNQLPTSDRGDPALPAADVMAELLRTHLNQSAPGVGGVQHVLESGDEPGTYRFVEDPLGTLV